MYELMIEIEGLFYGNGAEFEVCFGNVGDIKQWCQENGYKVINICLRWKD